MASNIILFPNIEKLQTEIKMLRTELSMLMLERDELLYVECKNIEMAYMLELGALEYKLFEAQCTYLRLKRKVDLIQAKKNRQEKIDLAAIDGILDNEFFEYQEKLNERIDQMNNAIERSNNECLSQEEYVELKKKYHRIVKALHPDLHPDVGQEKIKLFYKAVEAYENGDLNTLRLIDEMVSGTELPDKHEDAIQVLIKEIGRLKSLIASVKKNIESIKSDYPYVWKDLLADKKKIEERKKELNELLEKYRNGITACESVIAEMVR